MVIKNKLSLILSLFLMTFYIQAQDKVQTKSGTVKFEASVPSFEEVKATANTASCVVNLKNGDIASLILVKGFRFKIALMEEHFNENYIESHKYPKAVFKGKIQNFDASKLTSKAQKYTIKGTMELHGKFKEINIQASIYKKDDVVYLSSDFELNTDDFDISIPKTVSKKVSKNVQVSLDFELK